MRPRNRFLGSLFAIALLQTVVSTSCGGGSEPSFSCDDLCDSGGYGSAEEVADADGKLRCACGGVGAALATTDCSSYCKGLGRSADDATLEESTCVCGP